MLKKCLCLGDSSSSSASTVADETLGCGAGRDTTSLHQEYSTATHPPPKIRVIKSPPHRLSFSSSSTSTSTGKELPSTSSSSATSTPAKTPPSSSTTTVSHHSITSLPPHFICGESEPSTASCRFQLWRSFKSWFRGLCVCGGKRRPCTGKLAAWRSFRKDCFGSVPVTMGTRMYTSRRQSPPPIPRDSAPPPPYEVHSEDYNNLGIYNDVSLSEKLFGDSSDCSLETGGRTDYDGRGTPWCKILYWEGKDRKGNIFPVLDPAINILGDTPHGSGLSLAAFFGGPPTDERIRKTRRKICQGLVLWREGKVIWVYNRSEAPVYLNSASLDGSFFNLNLYKCPPGYAMIIYYYEMAHYLMGLPDYKNSCLDKADVNSVRISFAKGWGKNYHRREILCCPCWIEVHVVPTLKVEKLTPPR